jgi:acyl dehydratase
VDPAAEGTIYPDVAFTVDPERVRAFRAVLGIDDGVPPTFLTAAEFTVVPTIVADPRLAVDFSRVVHGSQEYAFERPLREGEQLTIRAKLESVRVRSGTGFVTIAIELFDTDDALVATCRSSMVERAEAS